MKSFSVKKGRGHRTSKTVKSKQSYINGHLPYHCSFQYLARARCMTWHVDLRAQQGCAETISANVLKFHFAVESEVLIPVPPRILNVVVVSLVPMVGNLHPIPILLLPLLCNVDKTLSSNNCMHFTIWENADTYFVGITVMISCLYPFSNTLCSWLQLQASLEVQNLLEWLLSPVSDVPSASFVRFSNWFSNLLFQ